MVNIKKKTLFGLIIVIISLSACNNRAVYSDYTEIPSAVWAKDRFFSFNVEIDDVEALYEIDLLIRNNDMFPRQNLWLSAVQEHNGLQIKVDTVNVFLLDEQGKWRGKGLGTGYDNYFIWQQRVKFPAKGNYVFRFGHLMRIDVLEGIERIGIEVIKEKQY
ncbi:hypothetical protein HW49_03885 [Porphyromonadaceae bacterium COT-184 OH4590]|nr:hypothetical protein HW49_03885 [Porphyromonadaceae bacterium COT-184 OH4590]MDO4726606.1 gliding motility lipoprotein GldH [Porphyromonadaceae bacterium]